MDTPNVLQQALEALSHQQLLNLVLNLSRDRADFGRALLAHIRISEHILQHHSKSSHKVNYLKQEIDKFFDEIQALYDYSDREYDEDEKYPELAAILDSARKLTPEDLLEVLWHLITCGNQMFQEEDFILATPQLEEAIGLYAEAVCQLSREATLLSPDKSHYPKRPYFDFLINALSWQMCSYGEVSDAIEKALETLCTLPEDYQYLIQQLKNSDYSEADELIATYYRKLGDDDNYLQYREKNLNTESQYLELAEYWRQNGNNKKYVATLEKWVTKLPHQKIHTHSNYFSYISTAESSLVLQNLAEHYRLVRDNENLCRIWMTMAEYGRVSLDLYKKINSIALKLGKWNLLQPNVIAFAKRDSEKLAQIYLYEKDWPSAIALAHQQPNYEPLQILVAEGIKEHHPQHSLKIYEQLVQHYIDLKSGDRYRIAARHAEAIKSIYLNILSAQDGWQDYITELRLRYPHYRALQEEFRQL